MATATVGLKLNNPLTSVSSDMTQESQILNGVATLSAASQYLTNGLPLTWTGIQNAGGASVLPQSNSTTPYDATFKSNGGSGYEYSWDQTHNTLRIFTGGVEVTNGTNIPAAVYADLIVFKAWYKKA